MEREPFVVDLNNPDDMRAKLADAQAILRDHEREVRYWRSTVDFMKSRVPAAPAPFIPLPPRPPSENPADGQAEEAPSPGGEASGLSDLVTEVVNRETRKIRSIDVCKVLTEEGHDVSTNSVSNALYYAAHKAQPPKIKPAIGRGMYAPLSFEGETNFDPPQKRQVSQARPEEPYSAPEGEDRREAPRGLHVEPPGPVNQGPQQMEPALGTQSN